MITLGLWITFAKPGWIAKMHGGMWDENRFDALAAHLPWGPVAAAVVAMVPDSGVDKL